MAETPHLKDLFKTGRQVTLGIYDSETEKMVDVVLWMRKPIPNHYEEALAKARGKQGRRRQLFRDHESDEYLAFDETIRELDSKDKLVDELMSFEQARLRTQSYNEALFGDNDTSEEDGGPRWGREGGDYLDVIAGLQDRYQEIETHNESLAEEDKDSLSIKPEEDDEIVRLNNFIDEFGKHRDEILERTTARERAEYMRKTTDTLRKELLKKMIELDVNLVHYQEFKTQMLVFSCRYPEDHKRFYFSGPDEIWDLPDYVRMRLFDEYDKLEQGAEQLKNSLSPQPS